MLFNASASVALGAEDQEKVHQVVDVHLPVVVGIKRTELFDHFRDTRSNRRVEVCARTANVAEHEVSVTVEILRGKFTIAAVHGRTGVVVAGLFGRAPCTRRAVASTYTTCIHQDTRSIVFRCSGVVIARHDVGASKDFIHVTDAILIGILAYPIAIVA